MRLTLGVVTVAVLASPALASAQSPSIQGAKEPRSQGAKDPRSQGAKEPRIQGSKDPRSQISKSIQVQASAGPTLFDVGHSVAGGIGVVATEHLAVVVLFERTHNPSQVTERDGVTSASRRGTLTTGSVQVQVALRGWDRAGPYGLAGVLVGVSRPTVNEIFPDRVTHGVGGVSLGGGVHVPLADPLSLFADVRFSIACCALHGAAPVRVGLTWSF